MSTQNRIKMTLLSIFLILSLTFNDTAFAQSGGGLFGDGVASDVNARVLEPYQVRARYVTVNTAMLFGINGQPLGMEVLPEINLNLFPDVNYTGRVTRAWSDEWGSYWIGHLDDVEGGSFYLTTVDGAFMSHVASPLGVYEVAMTQDGLYQAVEIDQSKFTDHDPSWEMEDLSDAMPEDAAGAVEDGASVIDIMVAYTDDARVAAGGVPAIKATILTALNETNTSYVNSGVLTRLRLVHVEEYAYVESGNLSTDLNRFANTTDPYFSTIHTLRNTYGADMVGLIVENAGSYCGKASAIKATEAKAYMAVDRGCATGYYSFGHEFGHLQGARHDKASDARNAPYAYGHGYVHTGATAAKRWRTIMAENKKCLSLGYSCTRLNYWSNPTKTYNSNNMGVTGSSENYKVLNNTALSVANFRHVVIGNPFNSTFNANSSGWIKVRGTWTLKSGRYRTGGTAGFVASAKHTRIYGDFTYTARMKRLGSDTGDANMLIIRGNPVSLNADKYWKSSYIFEYTNAGRFGIWRVNSDGSYTTLITWTTHAAIVQNGWNTLRVVAVGKSLKFFINGQLVWVGNDTGLRTGQVGLGMVRGIGSTGNNLLVDWARLSNTPTADPLGLDLFEQVVPGVEIPGGSPLHSP